MNGYIAMFAHNFSKGNSFYISLSLSINFIKGNKPHCTIKETRRTGCTFKENFVPVSFVALLTLTGKNLLSFGAKSFFQE